MSQYIGQYISTYNLCLQTKVVRHSLVRELYPLPMPDAKWDTLSINFVVRLSKYSRCNAIMMVMDLISKRAHFILTYTTVTAEGVARLFFHNIQKLYRLLQYIILDCRLQFVALFTKELYQLLEIQLASSTVWHLQTDGQTEYVNQELNQYLCLFINKQQDDWYDLLSMVKFQYNNHIHASIQQTLFLLDTRCTPHIDFEPRQQPSRLEIVNKFIEQIKIAVEEAKFTIQKAQEDIMHYYNLRRSPAPVFHPKDQIFLDISNIKTIYLFLKLLHCCLRSFIVEYQVGSSVYYLKLPYTVKKLHPVFNIVKLSVAPEDPIPGQKPQLPPPLIIINKEEKQKVEEILNNCWYRSSQ